MDTPMLADDADLHWHTLWPHVMFAVAGNASVPEGSLSQAQKETIRTTATVSGSLGAIGAGLLLAAVLTLRYRASQRQTPGAISEPVKTSWQRLMVWLALADCLLCFGFALTDANADKQVCQVQAALLQIGGTMGASWTTAIAVELFFVIHNNRPDVLARRYKMYHLVIWTICGSTLIVLLAEGAFGQTGAVSGNVSYTWCWINKENQWARFAFFYIPLVACWITMCVLYGLIIRRVYTVSLQVGYTQRSTLMKLGMYPVVFCAVWTWGVLARIQDWVSDGHTSFFFVLMHATFVPAQGMVDAIVFGCTNRIIRARCLGLVGLDDETCCVSLQRLSVRSRTAPGSQKSPTSDSYSAELTSNNLTLDVDQKHTPLLSDTSPYSDHVESPRLDQD